MYTVFFFKSDILTLLVQKCTLWKVMDSYWVRPRTIDIENNIIKNCQLEPCLFALSTHDSFCWNMGCALAAWSDQLNEVSPWVVWGVRCEVRGCGGRERWVFMCELVLSKMWGEFWELVLSKISDNKLFVLYVGMIVKKNKYIKAKNKAQVTKGAPEIPHVTIQNAPANLRQPNEMPPEAVVFLLFRNDSLFQIGCQTTHLP